MPPSGHGDPSLYDVATVSHLRSTVVAEIRRNANIDNPKVTVKKAQAWCASKENISYQGVVNVEEAFQCIAKNALKSGEEKELRGLIGSSIIYRISKSTG